MRKAYRILIVAIGASIGGGLYLYERYIGFPEAPLERRVPNTAYAYFSIAHLRQAALAVHGDAQLEAAAQVLQAVALSLLASLEIEEVGPETPSIDPALLNALAPHFKTQLAVALLPSQTAESQIPDVVMLTNFYGDPGNFASKLHALAQAASSDETRYQWETRIWNGFTLRHLPLSPASETSAGIVIPAVSINWSITSDILYVASNPAALETALQRHDSLPEEQSLARDNALTELPNFTGRSDLTLQIRAPQSAEFIARLFAVYQNRNLNYLSAVSLPKLFRGLGIADTESLTLSASLGKERELYLGARLKERRGLWQALGADVAAPARRYEDLSIQSSDTVALDPGEALLLVKDAVLGAAPIAGLPYFFYQNKLFKETGIKLDPVLRNGFENQVSLLQTLDVGMRRSPYGALQEAVVHDASVALPLARDQQITRLLDAEIEKLRNRFPHTARFEEFANKRVFILGSDPDPGVTAGSLAVYHDAGRVVIGRGTLRSFRLQLESEEVREPAIDSAAILAGEGLLELRSLPSELSRLATVFFRQHNPQMDLPPEFLIFDWDSLSALELRRSSALFDLDKHIYWHSHQL